MRKRLQLFDLRRINCAVIKVEYFEFKFIKIMTLQICLCGTGQDLFKDAMQEGKLSEGTPLKVGYDDVFSSPWCCDSSHEERYETLISQIHQLDLDSTVVVLLSVMCLFDSEQVEDLSA